MKKTLFAFMALATAFAVTSCQSDEEFTPQPISNKPMVINAVAEGIGTGTRATMAYKYDILWSENDDIYVANSTKNAIFTLQSGAGTANGSFACESSPFESGDAVEAYYPASLIKDGNLVWPDEQTSSTVIPMYSKQTLGSTGTEDFTFASLGAILQIVFNTKQENVTLKSITIMDDTKPLSGAFTVDEDGKAVMAANTDAPGITYDLGDGKALGDGANYFNIAVPAGTYSNLSIIFTTTDGTTCTMKGSVTLKHNTVGRLTLTGKEFKRGATRGTAKATINGSIVDVNWIQLWPCGPKFAEYNVGVTDGKMESFGGYYAWGGTHAQVLGTTFVADYNTTNTGTGNLTGNDDTATALWGNNWRMPTYDEFNELADKCYKRKCIAKAETVNGVKGTLITGTGDYSSNSVFFPSAGSYYSLIPSKPNREGKGIYWSSTPSGNQFGTYIDITTQISNSDQRALSANSVRAVLNKYVK